MPETSVQGEYGAYTFSNDAGQFQIRWQRENTKTIPLVSPRDSNREAERLLGTFKLRHGYLAIVFGAAAIPLLRKLRQQQIKQGGDILVVEADPPLARKLAEYFPDLFTAAAILTRHNPEFLGEYAEQIQVEQLAGYRIFSPPGPMAVAPQFYREQEATIKQLFASRLSDLFTRIEFESRWVFNALNQLPHLYRAKPAQTLFSTMAGRTAVIVSTGPSLRLSLPWLKKMQHRAFLACADSAWRVLQTSGITPHLVFTLDSQAHTLRHLLGMPRGNPESFPVLYADLVANPQVTRRWQGQLIFGLTAHYSGDSRNVTPGCDFIEERLLAGLSPGDVQSGGSVATSIFDLLRRMNFSQIIFTGQDLAYTWREIHVTGTHHTKQWLSAATSRLNPIENINEAVLRKRHVRLQPSMHGRPIPADYVLSLYRKWFADAIAVVPQKVYNATVDGLAIPGAIPLSLDEQNLPGEPDFPAERVLAYIKSRPSFGSVQEFLNKVQQFWLELASKSASELPFLKYAGRKFDIMALRSDNEENAAIFRAQSQAKQQEFLATLRRYLPLWRRELDTMSKDRG